MISPFIWKHSNMRPLCALTAVHTIAHLLNVEWFNNSRQGVYDELSTDLSKLGDEKGTTFLNPVRIKDMVSHPLVIVKFPNVIQNISWNFLSQEFFSFSCQVKDFCSSISHHSSNMHHQAKTRLFFKLCFWHGKIKIKWTSTHTLWAKC